MASLAQDGEEEVSPPARVLGPGPVQDDRGLVDDRDDVAGSRRRTFGGDGGRKGRGMVWSLEGGIMGAG